MGFHLPLTLLVIPAVFPFYWTAISSLTSEAGLFALNPTLAPGAFSGEFYGRLVLRTALLRSFANSLIGASATVALVSVFVAYALARFRGGEPFALSLPVGQMFPSIPLIVIMSQLKLLGSDAGLVIACLTFALPCTAWVLRGYFMGMPEELEEAALIDGCSRMGGGRARVRLSDGHHPRGAVLHPGVALHYRRDHRRRGEVLTSPGAVLAQVLPEEREDLVPAIHGLLLPVGRAVVVEEGMACAVVAVERVDFAVPLQFRLVDVHLLGRGGGVVVTEDP